MAKESIDTIISQEALEQFIELGRRLDNVYVKMESLIGKVFDLNKAMSMASGAKEAAQAMNEQSKAADELNKTNSERLNMERKIKEEGAKMAQQVKEETDNFEKLAEVMEKHAKTQGQTALEIVKLKSALEGNKNAIKNLSENYKAGRISIDKYKKEQADLIIKKTELKKALSDEQKTLKQVTNDLKSADGSQRQMAARLAQLKDLWKGLSQSERENVNVGGVLKTEINNLDEALKGLEKSIGESQRSVGGYEIAIQSLMSKLPGFNGMLGGIASSASKTGVAFGTTLVNSLKSVGKAMLSLMANPLIALIAGLAALIMGIVKAIKRNEEQLNRLKQAFAPLTGAIDLLLKILGKVADILVVIIEKAIKAVGKVMSIMEKIPFIGEKIKDVNDKIAESANRSLKIEQERQRIQKEAREELVLTAKNEKEISKLRNEAKNTEKYTSAQRIAKLEQAIELEKENLQIKLKNAAEEEKIIKMQIANMGGYSKASTELKDELAQAQAERYNAAKEFYDATRRMESELNTFRKEIEAERKRKGEERLAYIKKLKDEIKAIEYESASDIEKFRMDMFALEQWRVEEKKKHPKQIALIEELYLKKSAKLKEEYNKKESARVPYVESRKLETIIKSNDFVKKSYEEMANLAKWRYVTEINEAIKAGVKGEELEKLKYEAKKKWHLEEIKLFELRKEELIKQGMSEEEYFAKLSQMQADGIISEQDYTNKVLQMNKQITQQRMASFQEMVGGFTSLGSAIAQNIQDEKERIRVEAQLALVQALVNEGIAIAQVIIDPGDPYTKAFRIIANVAAIVAAMATATAAFSKASAAIPYAEGTDYHKGGAALIGEAGEPEIVMIKNREPFIIDKPTLIKDFPVGAKVIPMHKVDNVMSMTETNELLKAIKNKATVNINVSDEITTYIQSKLNLTKVIGGYFKA